MTESQPEKPAQILYMLNTDLVMLKNTMTSYTGSETY